MKKYFGMIAALLLPLVAFSASSGSLPYDKTTLGNSTNSNKSLIFNLGNGSSNPGFRGNDTSGKVEFTQDGSTWKAVGAGGGAGGGGVVLNENGGFEDGATAWTASGGTFTIETTLANVGFGLQSGAWDASANAETLSNTAVAVPAGLYGKTCSLSWYYKGGDSNLKAQVFDGTNVLAESSAFTAQATFSAKQAMYFPCPSSGNIQARFIASGNILMGSQRTANREIMKDVNSPLRSKFLDQYAFDSLDPNKPFAEVGYGIDNIFKILRVQAFHRLTYLDHGNPQRFRLMASVNFSF